MNIQNLSLSIQIALYRIIGYIFQILTKSTINCKDVFNMIRYGKIIG